MLLIALTVARALAERVDSAVSELLLRQIVCKWLCLADVVLDEQRVRGVAQHCLSAQLESRFFAHSRKVHLILFCNAYLRKNLTFMGFSG